MSLMKTITDFFMQGGTAATLIILSLTICLGLMLGQGDRLLRI